MNTLIESTLADLSGSPMAQRLLDAGLKVTLLLAALLITSAIANRVFKLSAAKRASLLWLGSLASPLVLALSLWGGQSGTALWKFETAPIAVAAPDEAKQVEKRWAPALVAMVSAGIKESFVPQAKAVPAVEAKSGTNWGAWSLWIWVTGAALVGAWLFSGVAWLRWRVRRSAKAIDSGGAAQVLRRVSAELGLRRVPSLWAFDDDSLMPMTWGAVRHHVALPASADSWDRERLELVLRHELGHIVRRDCLAGWVQRIALAPLWFHPLAWLLLRQSGELRERACDDLVTAGGEQGVDRYAHELVAFSRAGRGVSGALAMARPKRLEARIRALYCNKVGRASAGRAFHGSVMLCIATAVLPMCLVSACQTVRVETPPVENPFNSPVTPRSTDIRKGFDNIKFAKGDKKVIMKVYEVTTEVPGEEFLPQGAAENGIRRIPAAIIDEMPNRKGADTMTFPAFPTGKRHELFVGRRIPYLVDPDNESEQKVEFREAGVRIGALVRELRPGELSVEFEFQVQELSGTELTPKGNPKPLFSTQTRKAGPLTIANGSGLSILVREDVQSTEDKVPILGDIPLIGGLFRSEAENHFARYMLLSFDVVDP